MLAFSNFSQCLLVFNKAKSIQNYATDRLLFNIYNK
jgi:hypothetical protein